MLLHMYLLVGHMRRGSSLRHCPGAIGVLSIWRVRWRGMLLMLLLMLLLIRLLREWLRCLGIGCVRWVAGLRCVVGRIRISRILLVGGPALGGCSSVATRLGVSTLRLDHLLGVVGARVRWTVPRIGRGPLWVCGRH